MAWYAALHNSPDQIIAPHTTTCVTKPRRSRAQERRLAARGRCWRLLIRVFLKKEQARVAGKRQSRVSCGRFLQVGPKRGRPYEHENDFARTVGVVTYPEAMKETLKEPGPSWSLFEFCKQRTGPSSRPLKNKAGQARKSPPSINYRFDQTGRRRRAETRRLGHVVWRAAKSLGLCGFL